MHTAADGQQGRGIHCQKEEGELENPGILVYTGTVRLGFGEIERGAVGSGRGANKEQEEAARHG